MYIYKLFFYLCVVFRDGGGGGGDSSIAIPDSEVARACWSSEGGGEGA